jgi:carbon starvation protein
MDTGVRLQRYIVQEIATIIGWKTVARNLTLAGLIGIALPLFLALMPGSTDQGFAFGTLWRLFGTTNQLTAGLALAVIAVWVTRNRRNPAAALIPMAFLLVMTVWALIIQLGQFWDAEERWILVPLDVIILVLALWLIVEAVLRMRTLVSERRAGVTESGDPTAADIDRGDSQQ